MSKPPDRRRTGRVQAVRRATRPARALRVPSSAVRLPRHRRGRCRGDGGPGRRRDRPPGGSRSRRPPTSRHPGRAFRLRVADHRTGADLALRHRRHRAGQRPGQAAAERRARASSTRSRQALAADLVMGNLEEPLTDDTGHAKCGAELHRAATSSGPPPSYARAPARRRLRPAQPGQQPRRTTSGRPATATPSRRWRSTASSTPARRARSPWSRSRASRSRSLGFSSYAWTQQPDRHRRGQAGGRRRPPSRPTSWWCRCTWAPRARTRRTGPAGHRDVPRREPGRPDRVLPRDDRRRCRPGGRPRPARAARHGVLQGPADRVQPGQLRRWRRHAEQQRAGSASAACSRCRSRPDGSWAGGAARSRPVDGRRRPYPTLDPDQGQLEAGQRLVPDGLRHVPARQCGPTATIPPPGAARRGQRRTGRRKLGA